MTTAAIENDLKAAIRTIPDYPKAGIMFRDITTLLGDARAFRRAVDELVQPWAGGKIDKVAGIEARGFILGGAVAHQVSAGFVPIRKKGKLPFKRVPSAIRSNTASTKWRCTRTPWRAASAYPGRRSDRHRRHRRGGGQAAAADRRQRARRLLRHRSAGTRRRGEAAQARRAGAHADRLRGALTLRVCLSQNRWEECRAGCNAR